MKVFKKIVFMAVIIFISLLSIVPFYFIMSMATHSTAEIYRSELLGFGDQLLVNMKTIIAGGFINYYWNTVVVAVFSGAVCVLISAMAAYGLTVYKFKHRDMVKRFIIASMMIPGQISLIGYAIEMRQLHLVNTLVPLVFTWFASAYGVFFVVQYMTNSLPMELIESARIDGSGEFRTFCVIALPLIKPAIGTLFMLIFLWSWNNFLMPSTVLTENSKFTIPLGIQTLSTAYRDDWGARGAALALAVIPLLIIFAIGSKYFIKGLAAGAVKG